MSHAGEGGTGARSGVGGRGAGEAGFGGGGGGIGGIGGGDGGIRGSTAAQRRGIDETAAQRGGEFGAFAGEDPRSGLQKVIDRIGVNLRGKIEGFVEKLKSPEAIGALAGFALGGPTGAKLGALGGSLLSDPSAPTTQAQAPPAAAQAAPTVAQAAPSVTPQDISAQRQFTNIGQLGGDGGIRQQVAAAPPPVSRESGVQPQLAGLGLGQRLPQQQFLNQGGILPTVNLGAFPGALGRA